MSTAFQLRLSPDLQDLNPILAGAAIASEDNSKMPDPHSYVLLHYVISGKGRICIKGEEYPVHADQAFLIMPGAGAAFYSDPDDPWSLRWIGFTGKLAHHFASLPPVFDIPKEVLVTMCDVGDQNIPNNILGYRIAAELMLLYSLLLEPGEKKTDYVQVVIDYIEHSYMHKLSVSEMAASLNLNRCYLSDLFKRKVGISIQQFLLKTRIEASKRHLLHGSSIKQAALLSGFSDVSNFTKLFSRECEATPSQFRKNAIAGTAEYHKSK